MLSVTNCATSTLRASSRALANGLALVLCLPSFVSALSIGRDQGALHISHGRSPVPQAWDIEPRVEVIKREDNARFTFYETGLGACGGWNNPTDFIVALNQEQWDGGSHCWEMITVTYLGKTTQAQIVDLCPGCPWGGLDMSPGLFSSLASIDMGVIYGTWHFGKEEAPQPAPLPVPLPPPLPSPSPSPSPPPPPPPAPTPEPQPDPRTQSQKQPEPTPQQQQQPPPPPSETSTSTTSTSVSTTYVSWTSSVTSSPTPNLQTNNTPLASRPSPAEGTGEHDDNASDSGTSDLDEPTSPYFQYESNDDTNDSRVGNLQDVNLAMVNLALLRSAILQLGQHEEFT